MLPQSGFLLRIPLIFVGAIFCMILIIIVVAVCVNKRTPVSAGLIPQRGSSLETVVQKAAPMLHSQKFEESSEVPSARLREVGDLQKDFEPKLNFTEYPLSATIMTPSEQEQLYDLTKEVLEQLDNHNVTYFAASGTLLGAVRHKALISWDDDVDIAVIYDQQNMQNLSAAIESLKFKNYPCGNTESGIKILSHNMIFPWLDLLLIELGPDNRYTQCGKLAKVLWPQVNYSKEHIFPLRKMKFGPLMIWCPGQSEMVLDTEFGSNWRTHVSYKPSSIYGLRLIKANKNVPKNSIREEIKKFENLLPKTGTLVLLKNVII